MAQRGMQFQLHERNSMKKKSASKSAFFNLRVLIGLFIALAGISLALVGLDTFAANRASNAQAQQGPKIINVPGLPPGFDCATIHEKGIDKMEGLKWGLIMIACGESLGGGQREVQLPWLHASPSLSKNCCRPWLGAADVDLITGTETSPNITQSETYTHANPDNPQQIVVAYNDSKARPTTISPAVSVSTDGGLTFTRPQRQWFQPVRQYLWRPGYFVSQADPDLVHGVDGDGAAVGRVQVDHSGGPTSWTHFCVHSGGDDRESGWADNNPTSPFWNNVRLLE